MKNSNVEDANPPSAASINWRRLLFALVVGTLFGIVLVKSQVAEWERIHRMFLFQEAKLFLIIGMGVVVGAICMWLIRKFGIREVDGSPISYRPKPFQKGVVIGGMIFGVGWAITGSCPGPIYAQLGGGEWMALWTLAGAMMGTFAFAFLKPVLPS